MAIFDLRNYRGKGGIELSPFIGALPYININESSLYISQDVISLDAIVYDSGIAYPVQTYFYGNFDSTSENSLLSSRVSGFNIASPILGSSSIYELDFAIQDLVNPSSAGYMLLGGNDVVYASDSNDVINTYTGNDFIQSSRGIDLIDGSEGVDTFSLGAKVSSLSIDTSGSGILRFSSRDLQSISTVKNVEFFEFDVDGRFSKDEVTKWAALPDYQFTSGIHRFYNSNSGVHFYTDSELEFDNLTGNPQWGYQYEGIAYQPAQTGIRLYRFYNDEKGYHFMTSNSDEAAIVGYDMTSGYRYEGRSYIVSTEKTSSATTEVHRFYHAEKGVHFYSSNDIEANIVISNSVGKNYSLENAIGVDNVLEGGWGYIYEGVAWYV